MSTYESVTFSCLQCGSAMTQNMLIGMHITRLPEVRDSILREDFQQYRCSECGFVNQVEKQSIYTDFERQQYIGVELPDTRGWSTRLSCHQQAFDRAFMMGDPTARKMGGDMSTRIVFGLRALREKILLWDAKWDDRIVEIGKRIILDASDLDVKQYSLRLLSIHEQDLNFGLFRHNPTSNTQSDSQRTLTVSDPIDTVTVFQHQMEAWHRDAQMLLEHNPWARRQWLVDASIL